MGLQPGDLVLGYDGVPWKNLYRSLLDAGVPVSYLSSINGSTPKSTTHAFLSAVGMNWGLFDTIDVVKYSSGDTLHLSTALLDTVRETVFASEQVPIAGVPMPQAPGGAVAVSWGVVQGTSTGYIYVWDWNSPRTSQLFQNAVDDLIHVRRVKGLVIDFRMNFGGNFAYGNGGLSQLFNVDPTSNLRTSFRNSSTDCMSFSFDPAPGPITPGTLYDHPIAVLIGPGCFSVGDYNALRMRFHPMARLFGKPTNGAFVAGYAIAGSLPGGWEYRIPTAMVYSNVPGEGYMMHKGVQPDEEVWLTRSGVANGEDDVVKRALAWMDSLSYAHDVDVRRENVASVMPALAGRMYAASDTLYSLNTETGSATRIGWIGPELIRGLAIRPSTKELYGVSGAHENTRLYRISASTADQLTMRNSTDSIRIRATVRNPGGHVVVVSAIVTDGQGSLVDSVILTPTAVDSVWSGSIRTPVVDGRYDVSVRTDDATSRSYRRLPNITYFGVGLGNLDRTIPIPNLQAIAFSPGDTLYGATTGGRLYRIDVNTGDTAYIGRAPSLVYSGLSFRPANGDLWASVRTPIDSVFTLNTQTGAPTFVGTTGFISITASLAFDPSGSLYALIDNGSGEDYLARLDTLTATGSIVAGPLEVHYLQAIAVRTDSLAVSVGEEPDAMTPETFTLLQNYPNPANPSTTIRYALPRDCRVSLRVYNVLGQEVATLVSEDQKSGYKSVEWKAAGVASGVYFYRLDAGSFSQVRKLMLLR